MASISQGLMLTTAMVFSSTAIYLAFHWHKNTPPFQFHANSNKQTLHSCLYSSIQKKRGVRNLERKKKRVKFAENVMEPRKESEEMKKEQRKQNRESSKYWHETPENIGIPAKVKVHKMASSF